MDSGAAAFVLGRRRRESRRDLAGLVDSVLANLASLKTAGLSLVAKSAAFLPL